MRLTHQISLRRLAGIVGVSPAHLSRVERGQRDMTVDLYGRITTALATLPAPAPVTMPVTGVLVPTGAEQ